MGDQQRVRFRAMRRHLGLCLFKGSSSAVPRVSRPGARFIPAPGCRFALAAPSPWSEDRPPHVARRAHALRGAGPQGARMVRGYSIELTYSELVAAEGVQVERRDEIYPHITFRRQE